MALTAFVVSQQEVSQCSGVGFVAWVLIGISGDFLRLAVDVSQNALG